VFEAALWMLGSDGCGALALNAVVVNLQVDGHGSDSPCAPKSNILNHVR
jgi:hypothetical protein